MFANLLGYSDYTEDALQILWHPERTMQWYIIPLLLIVLYLVAYNVKKKRYNVVLGGLAFWLMDVFNEVWNSYVCFSSGYAPVWGTPPVELLNGTTGTTSFMLLIGYNAEISLMFAVMGMMACMMLPDKQFTNWYKNPNGKVFLALYGNKSDSLKEFKLNKKFNNRVPLALLMTLLCTLTEMFLNACGVLTWDWSWWSLKSPWLLYLIGYLPFFTMAYLVHDAPWKTKWILIGLEVFVIVVLVAVGIPTGMLCDWNYI